ncbi:MAG: hypothetical protein ABJA70_22215 [Chryseolinea sp.]
MMCRLLFGMLLLVQLQSIAQSANSETDLRDHDRYIINAKVYNKGVYKTFEEFKYNMPSIVENYSFDKKNLWLTDNQTGKQKKIKKREIWGFSDRNRIYVSWHKYDELLEKGRYCYFKEKGTRVVFGFSVFPPMILPIPLPYKDELIINFNTGRTFLLSKKLLKKILVTDDKELLNEFMNEKHKGRKLFEYVIKYNARNVSRIK